MKFIYTLLFFLFVQQSFAQTDTLQQIIDGRQNAAHQQEKPYVILISADGFRYDLAEKFQAKNLLKFANSGVKATSMIPSFPSITFPNHYSIVTGLYPSHHGIIDNQFFDKQRNQRYSIADKSTVSDGSWYGGIPIWSLTEREKMLSAALFWVGSESDAGGIRPSYYYNYNDKFPITHKVKVVTDWLQLPPEKRPHLITFYFPEVDHALHMHGVASKEGREAVQFVDEGVAKLVHEVRALGLKNVNFVFVSDHGMIDVTQTIPIPEELSASKFEIANTLVFMQAYAKEPNDVEKVYRLLKTKAKGYQVFLKNNMPEYLHFGTKDDVWGRIGDLILLPDAGKIFVDKTNDSIKKVGKHGYDPYKVPQMRAVFMAWGDQIKPHQQIAAFENVHVYPFIAKILGLHISNGIDGDEKVLQPVLR